MKTPMEIREDGIVLADSELDGNGRARPIASSERFYPCTGIIVAVSQEFENSLVSSTKGIETAESGLLAADADGRTSRPGVFAAGDIVHGARTVVEAVATGKRVAESMHAYMQSLPVPNADDCPDNSITKNTDTSVQTEYIMPEEGRLQ